MPRPTVKHDGFLVPHAGDVVNPKMAEPDRIDFNTLGNDRWGVIQGCLVTVSGAMASTLGGIAVVNGVLVIVKSGSALLGVGAAQDRFDLVVTDGNGTLKVVAGAAGDDPVFPDPPPEVTVLAAVFCPSGAGNFVDNVIDKRNWLADALLTSIEEDQPLIKNLDGNGDLYRVMGDGHKVWGEDTEMFRISPYTLQIIRNLLLDGFLQVDEGIEARSVQADEEITGSNLINGETPPSTANPGDLFQNDTTGRIYVWQQGEWLELATIRGAVPVGAVIQSLVSPAEMIPLGWVPMAGQPITQEQYPSLFLIPALAQYISHNITTGEDTMFLPDLTGRTLISNFSEAGTLGGSGAITLTAANLPRHDHGATSGTGGAHNHSITINRAGAHTHSTSGGGHTHAVSDDGHSHPGADWFGGTASMIAVVWGGKNTLDALFNDSSHTYHVEPVNHTARAAAGVVVSSSGSGHGHAMGSGGDHAHTATVGQHGGHTHPLTVNPVGENAPLPFSPLHLTVFTYIRS